jgi:hypothetical protein
MTEADWNFPGARFLAYVLAAHEDGAKPLFIVLNGADEAVEITVPEWPRVARWTSVLDTSEQQVPPSLDVGANWSAHPRCVLAFAGQS